MKHPRIFKAPSWCKPHAAIGGREVCAAMVDAMSNWPKFHALLVTIEDVQVLRAYMVVELNTKNRPSFVSRIYKRLRAVREVQELDAMWSIFPGAGTLGGRFMV